MIACPLSLYTNRQLHTHTHTHTHIYKSTYANTHTHTVLIETMDLGYSRVHTHTHTHIVLIEATDLEYIMFKGLDCLVIFNLFKPQNNPTR